MSLNPGQILIGRYRIAALLGQGGMGSVYRAWDTRLNIAVALKEMLPQPGLDPELLDELRHQFQQEATVLARLSHPHLVSVIDFFEEGGNAYLVMLFVEGESLAEWIKRQGPVPEAQVLAWADELLDALAYCHEEGVLHRDIKPQNIIIRRNGQAVFVDFGLVKLWNPNDPRTRTVMRGMGTPEYAPPEQYGTRGQHTDPRSDLYSLGATLYHAITGQVPLSASDRMATPDQFHPPSQVVGAVGPTTEVTILQAMALRIDQRFADANAMRAALRPTQAAVGPPVASPPKSAVRRKMPRWVWGAAAALALLACGGAAWGVSRIAGSAQRVRETTPAPTASATVEPLVDAGPPTRTPTRSPTQPASETSTATATVAAVETRQPTATPTATAVGYEPLPSTATSTPTLAVSPTSAASPTATPTAATSYQPVPLGSVANATQGFVAPPSGNVTLGGVPFSVSERVFQSQAEAASHSGYPTRARLNMSLSSARRVRLLLTTGNGFNAYAGQNVGDVVAYCSGSSIILTQLRLGQEIREWHGEPNVVSTATRSREVWRGEIAGAGVMGHIDLLSLDLPDQCYDGTLEGIEVVDRSAETIGSLDPALNLTGVTVEVHQ